MRLKFGDRLGAAREIHAGSGYWSQDAAVQVLGLPETPTHLWVRWPGGLASTVALPSNATQITVTNLGEIASP
jgi:hypothetical protein